MSKSFNDHNVKVISSRSGKSFIELQNGQQLWVADSELGESIKVTLEVKENGKTSRQQTKQKPDSAS